MSQKLLEKKIFQGRKNKKKGSLQLTQEHFTKHFPTVLVESLLENGFNKNQQEDGTHEQ